MYYIWLLDFHLSTKFGAKIFINAQITAEKTKFKMAAASHLEFTFGSYF